MAELTWTDQPAEVEKADVLASLQVRGHQMEVRRATYHPEDPPGYFVTVGDLFRSQTVRCNNADVALQVMGLLSKPLGKRDNLPAGAVLL